MHEPLTIVARIEAKPGCAELVKTELLKLIAPTRAEQGCMQYDLHQDHTDLGCFVFIERWESRELWEVHMDSAHLEAFAAATGDSIEELIIHEMSLLE